MKTKHVLLGCGVALVVCVIAAIALVTWFSHKIMGAPRFSTPPRMKQAGVKKNTVRLSKATFLSDPRLGDVTDIAQGKFELGSGTQIGIAGTSGAAFVDIKASVKAFIPFNGETDRIDIIDVDNDGNCEFLDRGSWSTPAKLLDHNGLTVWASNTSDAVDDASAGDINGDGKLEFVVGYNGGGGISLLDSKGKELWNMRDANVWHVEMTDTNKDGHLEIVHSNAPGQITIRDAKGNVISQANTAEYFSSFSPCRWPTSSSPIRYLIAGDNAIWLFNSNGSTAAKFAAPSCRRLGDPSGTLVKLQIGKPDYLAVAVSFSQGSIFYLFDSTGKIVYEETMPEQCESIAALKLGKSQAESVLVGGGGRVWRYDCRTAKP